jgi:hypothetical protein
MVVRHFKLAVLSDDTRQLDLDEAPDFDLILCTQT